MSSSDRKSGQFVVPGKRLGVIEEFMAGPGTFVEHGTIYSKTTGRALLDMLNKKASVYPLVHAVNTPRIGSTVIGEVSDVRNKNAGLRILIIGKRQLSGFFTGILHVSDVSSTYIETMYSVCKSGDLMRAKVVSCLNRTNHLSTEDKSLGVIYAFCSRCGHLLQLRREDMWCPKCANVEMRKVAQDYGSVII
ncbi:MAG: exosome complex RNA-binding protein Csl4 [Candidatus Bathyarchaeota archaeon]|nr:MAG: exosome complex RNA-binding protein Csl4 [Candidatus Bathyarchaeota archaeon]